MLNEVETMEPPKAAITFSECMLILEITRDEQNIHKERARRLAGEKAAALKGG
jgi:hypothetical protein